MIGAGCVGPVILIHADGSVNTWFTMVLQAPRARTDDCFTVLKFRGPELSTVAQIRASEA